MADEQDNEAEDAGHGRDAVAVSAEQPQPGFPILTFDPEGYRDLVAEEGWSREQEDEYLTALWSIIVGFVDLGFQIIPPTGAVHNADAILADAPADMINSSDISDSFNHCTAAHASLDRGAAPQNRTDS